MRSRLLYMTQHTAAIVSEVDWDTAKTVRVPINAIHNTISGLGDVPTRTSAEIVRRRRRWRFIRGRDTHAVAGARQSDGLFRERQRA
jgi:hypothetical protein